MRRVSLALLQSCGVNTDARCKRTLIDRNTRCTAVSRSSEVKCEDCVSRESLWICIYSLMSLSVFEHLKTHYNRGVARSRRIGYNRIVGYRLLASTFIHCYRPQTKFPKVMFLHLSVSHFIHGGVCIQRGWVCIKGGLHPRWDLHPRGVCIWGACIQGVCIQEGWADAPLDIMGYGQQAGGMHPTGMHSCLE